MTNGMRRRVLHLPVVMMVDFPLMPQSRQRVLHRTPKTKQDMMTSGRGPVLILLRLVLSGRRLTLLLCVKATVGQGQNGVYS